jgi:hypothetical protein
VPVSFTADQDAHVYLYQIDSSGKVQTLFPNAELSAASPQVAAWQSQPPQARCSQPNRPLCWQHASHSVSASHVGSHASLYSRS